MSTDEKNSILDYISDKIIDNQKKMATANAAGDNQTYFTCVGVRTALEALREHIEGLEEE